MFVIEDERHAEHMGEFPRQDEAMTELERLAALPWDQPPNLAPCTNWAQCGRSYELVEFDVSQSPWRELSRRPVLEVTSSGVRWQ